MQAAEPYGPITPGAKNSTPQQNYLVYALIGVLAVGLIGGILSIVECRSVTDNIGRYEELGYEA
jgi:hypothetical protein